MNETLKQDRLLRQQGVDRTYPHLLDGTNSGEDLPRSVSVRIFSLVFLNYIDNGFRIYFFIFFFVPTLDVLLWWVYCFFPSGFFCACPA